MTRARIAIAALTLSAAGLIGVLNREGIELTAYADPVHGWAVPTIGAGSTEGVKRGDKITPLEAVVRADRELKVFGDHLKKCIGDVPLYQHEYDAYVRLSHNIGAGAFCNSTIVKRLKAQDYKGACAAILMWDRAGPVYKPSDRCSHPDNKTCRGIWNDRLATKNLCENGYE